MRVRLATALLPLALCACAPERTQRSAVLIVVDTLRADHLGTYGHDRDTTPHLDARAAQGHVFEHAWSTSSWTLPSFGSMFTGQLPSRHQAGERLPRRPKLHKKLLKGTRTLAEELANRGYATGAIMNNPFLRPSTGLVRGFAHYDHESVNNERIRRADEVVDLAISWMQGCGDEPFFLVVHLFDPHMNYDPAPSHRGKFTAGVTSKLSLPINQLKKIRSGEIPLDHGDIEFLGAAYDEEIAAVDQEVERLLTWIETKGPGDSVVLFTSDHGEELFEHGGFEHGHALWEEVLHVPLMVWGPGVQPGRTADSVSVADIMPTLLDAVGIEPPPDLYGVSLWPTATEGASLKERPIVAEGILYGPPAVAMLTDDTKLVLTPKSRQMFRLPTDAHETRDVSRSESAAAIALTQQLEQLIARNRASQQGEQAEMDAKSEAALRALGYTK